MYFLYSKWVGLQLPTRHAIARLLNIPKTGPTHVQDNRIVADGYPLEAVEAALHDLEHLKALLDTEVSEPETIWELLIEKATYVEPKLVVQEAVVPAPEPVKKPETVEESNAKPEKIKVIHEPKPETTKVKKAPAKPRGRPKKAK